MAAIEVKEDADNVRYDPSSHRFWVGYGEGGLAAIDPEKRVEIADLRLQSHFRVFPTGDQRQPNFRELARCRLCGVVDREAGKLVNRFTLKGAQGTRARAAS